VAEGLFRYYLGNVNERIQVASAGIGALTGYKAHQYAIAVSDQNNIDIRGHIARQVTTELVIQSDLIFVMEPDQLKFLRKMVNSAAGKTYLLGHWRQQSIADPYGKGLADFEHMFHHIDQCIDDWLKIMQT
jgi:protein-tyrosine phosphatase